MFDAGTMALTRRKRSSMACSLIGNSAVSRQGMDFRTSRTITADHPSLAGHFPDAPIVPAVVILGEVSAALVEWRGDVRIIAIPAVKFLAALKPDQPFTIVLSDGEPSAQSEVDFSCLIDGQTAVRGRLIIGSQSTLHDERRTV